MKTFKAKLIPFEQVKTFPVRDKNDESYYISTDRFYVSKKFYDALPEDRIVTLKPKGDEYKFDDGTCVYSAITPMAWAIHSNLIEELYLCKEKTIQTLVKGE